MRLSNIIEATGLTFEQLVDVFRNANIKTVEDIQKFRLKKSMIPNQSVYLFDKNGRNKGEYAARTFNFYVGDEEAENNILEVYTNAEEGFNKFDYDLITDRLLRAARFKPYTTELGDIVIGSDHKTITDQPVSVDWFHGEMRCHWPLIGTNGHDRTIPFVSFVRHNFNTIYEKNDDWEQAFDYVTNACKNNKEWGFIDGDRAKAVVEVVTEMMIRYMRQTNVDRKIIGGAERKRQEMIDEIS